MLKILLILFLLPLSSYSLTKCEGDDVSIWNNCVGTSNLDRETKYEGEWKNGAMHGKGIVTSADGGKYEGEWKNGNYDGYGIFTADGGIRYEGQFKNGKFHGEGKIVRRDGSMYVGEYVNGLEHGSGVEHFNGKKIMGIWEKGKLIRRVYE